jgi:hypothetical protein
VVSEQVDLAVVPKPPPPQLSTAATKNTTKPWRCRLLSRPHQKPKPKQVQAYNPAAAANLGCRRQIKTQAKPTLPPPLFLCCRRIEPTTNNTQKQHLVLLP